jgi:hypothetical protein
MGAMKVLIRLGVTLRYGCLPIATLRSNEIGLYATVRWPRGQGSKSAITVYKRTDLIRQTFGTLEFCPDLSIRHGSTRARRLYQLPHVRLLQSRECAFGIRNETTSCAHALVPFLKQRAVIGPCGVGRATGFPNSFLEIRLFIAEVPSSIDIR